MSQKKAQLLNPLNGNLNVTGVVTASSFVGDLTGDVTGNVSGSAGSATGNAGGLTGTPNIVVGSVTAASGAFSGNVSVGGTLTYQDVEHIDSVGIITAQQGIQVLANGLDITGVSTFKSNVSIADSIIHTGDTDTAIRFPSADTFTVHTNGSERTRVDGDGRLLVATSSASGTHKLQVNGSAQIRVGESLILQNAAGSAEGSIECAGAGSNTDIRIRTNSTERLRVTHAGLVGIGTDAPESALHVNGTIPNAPTKQGVHIGAHSGYGIMQFTAATGGIIDFGETSVDSAGRIIYTHSNDALAFQTGNSESFRIDSSQRLLVNTTSSTSNIAGYGNGGIQLNSTTTAQANVNIIHRNNSANTHAIVLAKARDGAANGGRVQDDDDFGAISFQGFDGTGGSTYRQGAEIRGAVDGTPGNADMPGRLEFLTTPDGSATPTERLRIDSRGSILFSNGFMSETVKINTTARNGTQAVNLDEGMAHYFSTNSSGTWKPNFTMSAGDDINATIAIGDVFSPTMIVAKGATTHYATTIQVDGSDVTPEFSGGAPSDGGGSGTFDVYNYTIIKTGDDTFKAFGAVSTFE